jgi:DNA polymerase III delta prime subunit
VAELILSKDLKKTLHDIVKTGEMQNLLLCGSAGCGKSSAALAMCNELGCDVLFLNASMQNSIDTIRTEVQSFATSVSLTDSKKVVILDECDFLSANAQASLRGFIEECSSNCRFILTCNFKNRIIEPLHSRCIPIEFKIPSKEKPTLMMETFKRVKHILQQENVKCEDDKILVQIIAKYYPDIRRVLNELQKYAASGVIDAGILATLGDIQIKQLVDAMKAKDYTNVKKWASANSDHEPVEVFNRLYENLSEYLKPASIPQSVLIIAEYQYRAQTVANSEINLLAALIELMVNVEFK